MSSKTKKLINYIDKKGIRLTPQRKAVVKTLLENSNQHLSASDIYDFLKRKKKSLGLATIYRTLDLLENEGIVVKRDFDSETARYELVTNQEEHNHLICKRCGKVIEIPDQLPDNIKGFLLEKEEFHCLKYSVKFYGYCKDCYIKISKN